MSGLSREERRAIEVAATSERPTIDRGVVRRLLEALDAAEQRAEQLAKQLSRAHEDEAIERERAQKAEAEAERLAGALRKVSDARLWQIPGTNPDGSVSSSTMAECLAREALAQHEGKA